MKHLLFLLVVVTSPIFAKHSSPLVYLTWHEDPSSTMTIQWITDEGDVRDELSFAPATKDRKVTWTKVKASHKPLPQKHPHILHRVIVRHLKPNSIYEFRIGKANDKTYRFRTMPTTLREPIRFVVGGDAYGGHYADFEKMTKQAAKTNPRFALIGGDIAYSAPSKSKKLNQDNFGRWRNFFRCWMHEMKDKDGCLIPLFTTIGNHEVLGRYRRTPKEAELYYTFFDRNSKTPFYDFAFGKYAHFVFLDSQHTSEIEGKQTKWLKTALSANKEVMHRFAIYHVGAYPSTGTFSEPIRKEVRKQWVPLFEHYKLSACFENHDHAYKRTYPLLNGKKDSRGIVYFGDGSWGVKPRQPRKRPYIAKSAKKQQVLVVELTTTKRLFWAIDSKGEVIDTYEQKVG